MNKECFLRCSIDAVQGKQGRCIENSKKFSISNIDDKCIVSLRKHNLFIFDKFVSDNFSHQQIINSERLLHFLNFISANFIM